MTIDLQGLRSDIPQLVVDNLTIEQGQIYVVLGPNGAGKTTLMKALLGLLPSATAQTHLVNGSPFAKLSLKDRSRYFGYCPQSLVRHPDLNSERFLASAAANHSIPPALRLKEARSLLHDSGKGHLAKRALTTLSGGEWQHLILLSLTLKDAPYWFLDEPTNHLDPCNQIETFEYLTKAAFEQKRGILITSHDLSLLGLLHQPSMPPPIMLLLRNGVLQDTIPMDSPDLSQLLSGLLQVPISVTSDAMGRTFLHPGRETPND